jgi:beta-phosphoglucomutase-like phosphatase (HAD superfamily)
VSAGTPRAVVFDCDGTLADSEPHSAAAWVDALGRRGYSITVGDVAACTGLGYPATYAHLASLHPGAELPTPEEFWPEVLAALERSFDRGLKVFPDAAGAVSGLSFAGVPLGVASTSPRERLDLTLERSGLGRYFEATAAGDEVEHAKPAPDVYLLSAARLGIPPEGCLAVEDTGHGARAAVAAGMRVIGVARLPSEAGPLLEAGAALVDEIDEGTIRSWLE